jgi:hypothetical protein
MARLVDHAEVISPQEVRAEMADLGRRLLARYEDGLTLAAPSEAPSAPT